MQAPADKLLKTFGEIIKEHRIALKKSVYKISAEASIPKTTWRRIEENIHKDIYFTSIWKIAEGLEISPEKLIAELKERLGKDFSLID